MKKIINPLIIGKIGHAYGILGWNSIISYTENKIDIFKYKPWFIKYQKKWITITVEKKKIYHNKIIFKIKNIKNRNQAKKITNYLIHTDITALPNLKKFEYYWKDIINCYVFNKNGKYIGKIYHIIRSKINDILKIKNKNKEILIPFIINKIITKVDIIEKKIYVNWN